LAIGQEAPYLEVEEWQASTRKRNGPESDPGAGSQELNEMKKPASQRAFS
jgi:hypothetical protein